MTSNSCYYFVSLSVVMVLIIFHLLPSPLDPVIWSDPNILPSFHGVTAVNTILEESVVREYPFSGPECFAVSAKDGMVYAGTSDGTVVSLDKDGNVIGTVLFIGGVLLSTGSDEAKNTEEMLLKKCRDMSLAGELAWDTEQERKCGRPLGLRILNNEEDKKGILYVLDAYWGLFTVDLDNLPTVEHVFGPAYPISNVRKELSGDKIAHLFDTPKFYNDLDILPNGDIVFTDSSFKFTRSENRPEILDGAGRGRLFLYRVASKELRVLLCGLHFPNGVQSVFTHNISDNENTENNDSNNSGVQTTKSEDEIIFAELTRFRLIRVNVTTVQRQEKILLEDCREGGSFDRVLRESHNNHETFGVSIFTDSLPGLADNLRVDEYRIAQQYLSPPSHNKAYYLVGIGSKSTSPFSLLWLALQSRWLRILVGKLVPMKWVENLIPRYGLVLVVDETGSIVSSMHDPTGEIALVSVAFRHPMTGDIWLGSHSERYIAVIPHAKVPASWR